MSTKDMHQRTKIILGNQAIEVLHQKTVAIFGVGGVGGAVVEMLARSGVGTLVLIDFDTFDQTNLNRQILCTQAQVGLSKIEVAKRRILDIDPNIKVITHNIFFDENHWDTVFNQPIDFVVDAIDSVTSKFFLIKKCLDKKIAIISSMGAGNKLDPSQVLLADISKTKSCGLAKAIRKRLRSVRINKGLPVVFSTELPKFDKELAEVPHEKPLVGSISYMPNLFGIHITAYVIKKLTEDN
jgi:tRNA A37 threonylcarbamoyladenosine dehydratase